MGSYFQSSTNKRTICTRLHSIIDLNNDRYNIPSEILHIHFILIHLFIVLFLRGVKSCRVQPDPLGLLVFTVLCVGAGSELNSAGLCFSTPLLHTHRVHHSLLTAIKPTSCYTFSITFLRLASSSLFSLKRCVSVLHP